jgi:hypothetical protein
VPRLGGRDPAVQVRTGVAGPVDVGLGQQFTMADLGQQHGMGRMDHHAIQDRRLR